MMIFDSQNDKKDEDSCKEELNYYDFGVQVLGFFVTTLTIASLLFIGENPQFYEHVKEGELNPLIPVLLLCCANV